MLVNCHLLLIFAQSCLTQIRPDVLSGLILIQSVCTLMVESTRSVASGLSMSYKKKLTLCLLFLCRLLIIFANMMDLDQA